MLLNVTQVVGTETQAGAASRDATSCTGTTNTTLMLTRIDAGGQLSDKIIVKVMVGYMAVGKVYDF